LYPYTNTIEKQDYCHSFIISDNCPFCRHIFLVASPEIYGFEAGEKADYEGDRQREVGADYPLTVRR